LVACVVVTFRVGGYGGGGGGLGGGGGGYNGGGGGGCCGGSSTGGGVGGGGGSYSATPPIFAQSGAQSGNGQVSFCFTPVAFAGTPGFSNCHGKSVAALAQQYGDLTAAAAALGLPSVPALQAAIKTFCGS
jgi:hypothetical protein